MMRRASATHARNQRMTDSPHRRALLASLVLNGLIRAAGAAALGLAVQRSLDGAASRGALAAAFVAAALAIVWLRSRERSDAARLGAEYAYSLGAALDADRLGPTRRWVAA